MFVDNDPTRLIREALTEDGKTMEQEARDSSGMLGGMLIAEALAVAALLWWLL